MILYGWDDTGPARGEILAARVDPKTLDYGLDQAAAGLGWEKAFTAFSSARMDLIIQMRQDGADPELIDSVRKTKAAYVPIVVDELA